MKYDEDDLIFLGAAVKIDRDKLAEANLSNANNFWHTGEGHALAVSRRDRKKFDLEIKFAELDKDIREQMEADEEKISEPKVKVAIHRDQEYQRAYKAYLNACYFADRWEALRYSFRMRNDALRNLTQQQGFNHYGEVAGARERGEAREHLRRSRDDD